MKHWYVTGPGKLEVVDEPIPAPGVGEVLVRTAFTALSPGSNVHVYRTGTYSMDGSPARTEALYMGSGIIDAVGAGVTKRKPGDRVAMVGIGHQDYAVQKEEQTHLIPDGLSLRDASLTYLSAWSVSALHLGSYAAAETIVVIGLGLVGASTASMANQMGARVLALDNAPERVAFAQHLGLGRVEQSSAPGADERIAEYLNPNGPDLIIETSGAWTGLKHAIALARDYTRIAVQGVYRQPPPPGLGQDLFFEAFNFPSKFHYQRLQIIGCGSDPDSISEPVARIATRRGNFVYALEQAARGRLPLGKLVSNTVPADQIGPILERFAGGDRSMVGVVFDWDQA